MGKKTLIIPENTKGRVLYAVVSLGQNDPCIDRTQEFDDIITLAKKTNYSEKYLVVTGELQVYSIITREGQKRNITEYLDKAKADGSFEKEVNRCLSSADFFKSMNDADRRVEAERAIKKELVGKKVDELLPRVTVNEGKKLNDDWIIDFYCHYSNKNKTPATMAAFLTAGTSLISELGYTLKRWPEETREIQKYKDRLYADEANYLRTMHGSLTVRIQAVSSPKFGAVDPVDPLHITTLTEKYLIEEDAAVLKWFETCSGGASNLDMYYPHPINQHRYPDVEKRFLAITKLAGFERNPFIPFDNTFTQPAASLSKKKNETSQPNVKNGTTTATTTSTTTTAAAARTSAATYPPYHPLRTGGTNGGVVSKKGSPAFFPITNGRQHPTITSAPTPTPSEIMEQKIFGLYVGYAAQQTDPKNIDAAAIAAMRLLMEAERMSNGSDSDAMSISSSSSASSPDGSIDDLLNIQDNHNATNNNDSSQSDGKVVSLNQNK